MFVTAFAQWAHFSRQAPQVRGCRLRTWHGMFSAALLCLAGCVEMPTPVAYVKRGPAFAAHPRRIIAMPSVIVGGPVMIPIPKSNPNIQLYREADTLLVDQLVRMVLEFGGFIVANAEDIKVSTGHTSETINRAETGDAEVATAQTGKAFLSQLDPARRDDVLHSLGFDGVLFTTTSFGPLKYGFPNPLTVEATLVDVRTGTSVWTSRCSVETEHIPNMDWAQHRAARCTMAGVLVAEGLEQVIREAP